MQPQAVGKSPSLQPQKANAGCLFGSLQAEIKEYLNVNIDCDSLL